MPASFGKRSLFIFRITRGIAKAIFYPLFRLQVTGRNHLPEKGAFVLLPKHQRWEDIPLLAIAIQKPLYYVAKHELFENPLLKWFITSLGGIPLNRKRPLESRESIRFTIELLRRGEGVVIFPEGTYYREGMGPGQIGLIRMILTRFAIPFIPVGVMYTKKRWRMRVRVVIGKPAYLYPNKNVQELIDTIMKEIAILSWLEKRANRINRS